MVALYPYPLALLAIFHGGWTLDTVQCQLSGFVLGLGVIGSVFNITAIAINRYCYICHTVHYERYYTRRNTCLCLSLTWLLNAIATLPNFLLGSLICRVILLPAYLDAGDQGQRSCATQILRTGHFLTMFVVFVLFAVCWAPLNFIGLAVALDPVNVAPKVPEWLYVASYFLAYFNSCLNAVVYGLLNQNFQREYKQILLSLCTPSSLLHCNSQSKTEAIRCTQSPAVTNDILVEAQL
ncbi:melatonin receptor type 1C [Tachysurus ichikawai]